MVNRQHQLVNPYAGTAQSLPMLTSGVFAWEVAAHGLASLYGRSHRRSRGPGGDRRFRAGARGWHGDNGVLPGSRRGMVPRSPRPSPTICLAGVTSPRAAPAPLAAEAPIPAEVRPPSDRVV